MGTQAQIDQLLQEVREQNQLARFMLMSQQMSRMPFTPSVVPNMFPPPPPPDQIHESRKRFREEADETEFRRGRSPQRYRSPPRVRPRSRSPIKDRMGHYRIDNIATLGDYIASAIRRKKQEKLEEDFRYNYRRVENNLRNNRIIRTDILRYFVTASNVSSSNIRMFKDRIYFSPQLSEYVAEGVGQVFHTNPWRTFIDRINDQSGDMVHSIMRIWDNRNQSFKFVIELYAKYSPEQKKKIDNLIDTYRIEQQISKITKDYEEPEEKQISKKPIKDISEIIKEISEEAMKD